MFESTGTTAYELVGKLDAPVVALIHGLGMNRRMWREFVDPLAVSHRVLTYDLYGHGESSLPPSVPSLNLFAVQLKELLEKLEIDHCAVMGFSLGGMINRRFAMNYPASTSALIILNSPHERAPEEQSEIERRAAHTAQGGPHATIETSLQRWFTPEFLSTHTDIVDEVREWILSNEPLSYTQCREVLAKGVVELIRPQPPIDCPSLVITCQNDSGSTPAMSLGISSEIPGSQVMIIPRLQHLGLLEDSSAFIEPVMRFLSASLN